MFSRNYKILLALVTCFFLGMALTRLGLQTVDLITDHVIEKIEQQDKFESLVNKLEFMQKEEANKAQERWDSKHVQIL